MTTSIKAAHVSLLLLGTTVTSVGQEKITFNDHVLPIFRNACLNCHNPDKKKAGLDLSTYTATLQGSENGKVVQSGNASGSLLFKCVKGTEEPKMPPKGDRLNDAELALLEKWIATQLLETASGKAVAAASNNVQLAVVSLERPAGPPAMPGDLPLEPFVRTVRPNALTALAASPWAPLVAVGGQKQIILYHTETLEPLGILPFPEGFPAIIRFSRNGELLLTGGGLGGKSGKVVLWSIKTGERIAVVGDEVDQVLAADLSADHQFVALGGPNKVVKVYSTKDGSLIHTLKKHTDWVTAIAYSPDGKFIASADRNGGLQIWEGETGKEFNSLAGHKGSVTGLGFMSGIVASASEDGTIKLWDSKEGKELKSWAAHKEGAQSVDFSPDGRLVSAGRDKRARVWDQTGKQLLECPPFGDIALRAELNSERVVAGDWTGQIRVFALDGKVLGELTSNPPSIAEHVAQTQKLIDEAKTARPGLELALRNAEEKAQALGKDSAGAQPAPAVATQVVATTTKAAELNAKLEQQKNEVAKLREARGSKTEGTPEYAAANQLVQAKKAEIAQTEGELAGVPKVAAPEPPKVDPAIAEVAQAKGALEENTKQLADAEGRLQRWARAQAFMAVHRSRASLVEKRDRHEQFVAAVRDSFAPFDQIRNELVATEKSAAELPGRIAEAAALLAKLEAEAGALRNAAAAAEAALEKAAKAVVADPATAQSELDVLTKKLAEQTAEISKRREVRSTKEEGTPAHVEANALVQAMKPEIAATEASIARAKTLLASGKPGNTEPAAEVTAAREAFEKARGEAKQAGEKASRAKARLAALRTEHGGAAGKIAALRQKAAEVIKEAKNAKRAAERSLAAAKLELDAAREESERANLDFESKWKPPAGSAAAGPAALPPSS
ncbi:MAG TPA: c-type cytochrome domain-containing protein [Chthoniobacteraceae bacterium]|jgi:hypothetical protein